MAVVGSTAAPSAGVMGRDTGTGTRAGAEALGWSDRGAIAEGMEASLIAVRCAPTVDDVEEYLVNGITSEDVRWLDES